MNGRPDDLAFYGGSDGGDRDEGNKPPSAPPYSYAADNETNFSFELKNRTIVHYTTHEIL